MSIVTFNFGPKNPLFSFGNCGSKNVFHFEEATGVPYIRRWNSAIKNLPEFGARSVIFEQLVNSLLKVDREDQANYLIESFYYLPPDELNCGYNNAMVALEAIEACVPEIAYGAISGTLVAQLSDAVLCSSICKNSDEIATELWCALGDLISKFQPGANEAKVKQPKGKNKNKPHVVTEKVIVATDFSEKKTTGLTGASKEPIEDAVIKTPTKTPEAQAAPKVKVAFVLRGDMFPTKPGTSEYKKRYTEARSYFSKDKNLDKAVDYVVDKTELPTSFLVRNVTAEKLSEVYAQSPASVSLEDCAYGLVHKLAVLFLNTETAKSEALSDALVVIALNSSWEAVSKAPPPTEQEEILQRMNLSKAGVIADKK